MKITELSNNLGEFAEDREHLMLQNRMKDIFNLSFAAWEQVDKNPEEAKGLFKKIHSIASGGKYMMEHPSFYPENDKPDEDILDDEEEILLNKLSRKQRTEVLQPNEFDYIMEEYMIDIKKFGFDMRSHDIDFSGVDNKKVRYICEAMRNYLKEEEEVIYCSYCGNESLSLREIYADTYSCQDCDEPNPKGYLGEVGTKLVGPNCCKAEIIEVTANPTIYKIQWYNLDGQKTHILEQIEPHHEHALESWRNSTHSGIQYKILNPLIGGTGKLVVGGTGEIK